MNRIFISGIWIRVENWKQPKCPIKSITNRNFPGGAVVKNPPANAGDMSSSPGPGRSHMLWSN